MFSWDCALLVWGHARLTVDGKLQCAALNENAYPIFSSMCDVMVGKWWEAGS